MKLARKILAVALALCLMLPMAACGEIMGSYRIVETLGEQSYAIGFRTDDYVRYYVEAALQELAADGTVNSIAGQWFTQNNTHFTARSGALSQFSGIPQRTLIVGADPDAYPLSYQENGEFKGFDVDLARAVCSRLGWEVQFIAIKAENAYVELSSGNVDCAWGGLTLDTEDTQVAVLTPYLTDEIVIVTRADTGAKSLRGLNGGSLAITTEQKYMDILAANEKLMERFSQIKRLTGGLQALLDAVNSGEASAAMVSTTSLLRFGS